MTETTNSTLVAAFSNISDAEAAADELKSQGFSESDISITRDNSRSTASSGSTSSSWSARHHEGGFTGWLKSVFGSDEEKDRAYDDTDRTYYEDAVGSGHVLLSLNSSAATIDRAVDILNRHSPVTVDRDREVTSGTATAGAYSTGVTSERGVNESEAIPVMEEQLRVRKRAVLRGGVRVYTRVIDTPVEETVRLQEETVRVDRQPVNRAVTESDLRAGRDQVIEVKEYAEEPVVAKEARVVEEVRVRKDSTERTETVRDTVRRTEVEVEDLDKRTADATVTDANDLDIRTKKASTTR